MRNWAALSLATTGQERRNLSSLAPAFMGVAGKTRPTLRHMTVEEKIFFEMNGFVHIRKVFDSDEMDSIGEWVDDIGSWGEEPGKWMHHREETASGEVRLSRTENVVSYHPGMARLLMGGTIPEYVADCLGQDVFLFKEKINYK